MFLRFLWKLSPSQPKTLLQFAKTLLLAFVKYNRFDSLTYEVTSISLLQKQCGSYYSIEPF
jgi:hypothetical protein